MKAKAKWRRSRDSRFGVSAECPATDALHRNLDQASRNFATPLWPPRSLPSVPPAPAPKPKVPSKLVWLPLPACLIGPLATQAQISPQASTWGFYYDGLIGTTNLLEEETRKENLQTPRTESVTS